MLPRDTAARVGYDVVVADSVHHQVKGLRLADGAWTLLAGTGEQLRERSGSGPALRQALSTPWDVAWFIDRVVIAMAGVHQLWALHLATDPSENTVAVLGGTSAEGIRDGAKFVAAVRHAADRGKPVVALKVGRSDYGAKAAMSHTAALSGSAAVNSAAFRQLGVG